MKVNITRRYIFPITQHTSPYLVFCLFSFIVHFAQLCYAEFVIYVHGALHCSEVLKVHSTQSSTSRLLGDAGILGTYKWPCQLCSQEFKVYGEIGLRDPDRHHSRVNSEHPNWEGLCDHFQKKDNILHLNTNSETWHDNLPDSQSLTRWDNS